jgi:hypothetical protein
MLYFLFTLFSTVFTFTTVWPQCGTQSVMLMTNYYQGFQKYMPSNSSMIFQNNFTFNCNTVLPTTACFVPASDNNVNPFAAILMPFDSPTPLLANSIITIGYTVLFVENIDSYNTFGYGFDVIGFFGSSDSLLQPSAPAMGLSTGSFASNYLYPELDVLIPMVTVMPLRGANGHVCDTLNLYNATSSLPCVFFQQTQYSQSYRSWPFTVTLTFNFTGSSLWLMSALVFISSTGLVANLTNLQESWSSSPATPNGTHYFGLISQRSPLELTGVYLSVRPPVACTTSSAKTTTSTSITTSTAKQTRTTQLPQSPTQSTTNSAQPLSTTLPVSQSTSLGVAMSTTTGATSTVIDSPTTTSTEFTNSSSTTQPQSIPITTNSPTIQPNQTTTSLPIISNAPLETNSHSSIGGETELFIALFSVFAVICCCFIMCTLLRKRVRRLPSFRRIYFNTPRPLRLIFFFACRKTDDEQMQDYQEVGASRIADGVDDIDVLDRLSQSSESSSPPLPASVRSNVESARLPKKTSSASPIYSLISAPPQPLTGDGSIALPPPPQPLAQPSEYSSLPASANAANHPVYDVVRDPAARPGYNDVNYSKFPPPAAKPKSQYEGPNDKLD